jgi:hypothetical protein
MRSCLTYYISFVAEFFSRRVKKPLIAEYAEKITSLLDLHLSRPRQLPQVGRLEISEMAMSAGHPGMKVYHANVVIEIN